MAVFEDNAEQANMLQFLQEAVEETGSYCAASALYTLCKLYDMYPVIPLVEVKTVYEQVKAAIGGENVVLDIMPGAVHSSGDEHYFQREDISRVLNFLDKYR